MASQNNDTQLRAATTAASASPSETANVAPHTPTARKKQYAAAVVAVLAAFAIVVSTFFLFEPSQDADSANAANTSSTQQQDAGAVETDGSAPDASQEHADATGNASDQTAGAAGSASSSSGSSDDGSGASASKASGSSGTGQTSSSQASAGSSASATSMKVTLIVDSSGYGSTQVQKTVALTSGATAYDALTASGFSVNATQSSYGVYVSAIGGLAEKQHGSSSGWMYSVNGKAPSVACSSYKLQAGDVVRWYYVV